MAKRACITFGCQTIVSMEREARGGRTNEESTWARSIMRYGLLLGFMLLENIVRNLIFMLLLSEGKLCLKICERKLHKF